MDAQRRERIEQLAEACEHVLERRDGDRRDALYHKILDDVAALLARLRAELKAAD